MAVTLQFSLDQQYEVFGDVKVLLAFAAVGVAQEDGLGFYGAAWRVKFQFAFVTVEASAALDVLDWLGALGTWGG